MKNPIGLLIKGSFRYTTERLEELVAKRKPRKLIAVGDKVSANIFGKGIALDVAIVDNRVMRKPIAPVELEAWKTYNLTNPAGTIADEAWEILKQAVGQKARAKILVEGEEDLLTLVAVLSAPEGSMVVYGQPREGIVVVNVTEVTKRRIREIVERMEYKPSKD